MPRFEEFSETELYIMAELIALHSEVGLADLLHEIDEEIALREGEEPPVQIEGVFPNAE